jgi:hypothetical protein
MTRARTTALGAAAFFLVAAFGAAAHANPAMHDNVTVSPWKEKGKTVGAVIRAVLKPNGGHDRAQLGLMRTNQNWGYNDYFQAASELSAGHLLAQFPEETGLKDGEVVERTYKLRYGDRNKLKGGEQVEVISSWRGGFTATGLPTTKGIVRHIWGLTRAGIPPGDVHELPKADK